MARLLREWQEYEEETLYNYAEDLKELLANGDVYWAKDLTECCMFMYTRRYNTETSAYRKKVWLMAMKEMQVIDLGLDRTILQKHGQESNELRN